MLNEPNCPLLYINNSFEAHPKTVDDYDEMLFTVMNFKQVLNSRYMYVNI